MATKKKLQKSDEKNVHMNTDKTGYVVQQPNGKARDYKRLSSAEARATLVQVKLPIPSIVTANTYYWQPQGSASGRRSNERRHQGTIDLFCRQLNNLPTIEAEGFYEETCRNVYKAMKYAVNGKSTNLTGLIGECARWGLELVK